MQKENKSAIPTFDTSGRYEGGLKSLVKSLQWAFGVLLVLIVLMLIYFFSWGGYFSVDPQQEVIVMRFGKICATHKSGAHWYFPYPVHRFIRVQTNPQFLKIEFQQSSNSLEEVKEAFEPGLDNYIITGDENIVLTSWTVGYQIVDAEKYYTTLATPEKPVVNGQIAEDDEVVDADGFKGRRGPRTLLRNLFRQAVVRVSAGTKVDSMLRSGKAQYTDAVKKEFENLLVDEKTGKYKYGIKVVSVDLDHVLPPAKTKEAFDEVTAAASVQSTRLQEAKLYRSKIKSEANAEAAKIRGEAETYAKQMLSSLIADEKYFNSILDEFMYKKNLKPGEVQQNPRAVLTVLYNSTLAEAFVNVKAEKFILNSGGSNRQLWFKVNPMPQRPADDKAKKEPEK